MIFARLPKRLLAHAVRGSILGLAPSMSSKASAASIRPEASAASIRPGDGVASIRPGDGVASIRPGDGVASIRPGDGVAFIFDDGFDCQDRWVSMLQYSPRPLAVIGALELFWGSVHIVCNGIGWTC